MMLICLVPSLKMKRPVAELSMNRTDEIFVTGFIPQICITGESYGFFKIEKMNFVFSSSM